MFFCGWRRQAFIYSKAQRQHAHAGSRTRVTSMGGLYDAATLRAPRMSQRRYVFTRIGCTMVLHSLPGQAGSMWPTRMGAQAHEGRSRLHLSVCMAAQKCASAGNRTRVTSMATMYSTTRPLMLLRTVVEAGVLGEHHVFAKAVQPYCGGLPENLRCVRFCVETASPDPL